MQIASFQEVRQWDGEARESVNALRAFRQEKENELGEEHKKLERLRAEHKRRPLLRRLFGFSAELKSKVKQTEALLRLIAQVDELDEELNRWIDVTPDDLAEAKQMLVELKQAKKDLTIRKKEVRMVVRETNLQARVNNAAISNQVWANG